MLSLTSATAEILNSTMHEFEEQSSVITVSRVGELCGARFCPGVSAEVNPNLTPPEPAKIRLLNSIFLVCMAVAVALMIVGVNSLKR